MSQQEEERDQRSMQFLVANMNGESRQTSFNQTQRAKSRLPVRHLSPYYCSALAKNWIERCREWMNSPAVYRIRWTLHRNMTSVTHSSHIKHGVKCCLGVSLLTLPGHLQLRTSGRPAEDWEETRKMSELPSIQGIGGLRVLEDHGWPSHFYTAYKQQQRQLLVKLFSGR